ncbi:hypothetical protein P0136_07700 [Lentisphaerota bacterium ZTH]|nr:hypothetical protein JYG24_01185 [Lentisphaerota bacterium]WET05254.1 hypothetical protein P0136_07700 [Lentisphaerota bacterium ZTH]
MSFFKKAAVPPIEVKLVNEVKSCRTCKWFWGGIPPYGPYPAYSWTERYPAEVLRHLPQQTGPMEPVKWMQAVSSGFNLIDPAIMHGCRKAPIMTMGINPNLTSYFPSSSGARWAYPHFNEDEQYAYHYRHQTIFQESLDPAFLLPHIVEGTEIKAAKDGWIISTARSADHRWLLLTVQYIHEPEPTAIELAWTPDARYVVLKDKSSKKEDKPDFKRGEVIAGVLKPVSGINIDIFENCTSYYQRFINVLELFKNMCRDELADSELTIGEDVSQHDLIACASPGWSSTYDIPTERITENCVNIHGYAVSQVIQSRPELLVIVGRSSVNMFGEIFGPYLDLDWQGKDIFQLLKETTEREKYLEIKYRDYHLKTRIITCPHFSYWQNFVPHSRFSADAWQVFKNEFSSDTEILESENRVQPPGYNDVIAVRIDGQDDEIRHRISVQGWNIIMAYHFIPFEMMAKVLAEMFRKGQLNYDRSSRHLSRAHGACRFCCNDLWQFPEKCPYQKELIRYPKIFEKVAKKVLDSCRKTK